jgi:two-component system response regulator RegA
MTKLVPDDRPRALVAHPNESYAASVARDLERLGFSVTRCASGRAARERLESHAPALFVSELRLSDGPALSVIERARTLYRDTKVVVVTDYGSIASAVRCLRLGVHAYHSERVPASALLEGRAPRDPRTFEPPPMPLERATWEYLNRVVDHAGSISRGAELLGLDRRSLRRMLGKYAPPS